MSRPADPSYTIRSWATDANYSAGSEPWSAQPTKVEPPGSASGFVPEQGAAAEYFNKLFSDAFAQDTNAKATLAALTTFVGQTQVLNFTEKLSQSYTHAVWNVTKRAWYAIEATTNCKASFDCGWTWGSTLISGTDSLERIACDSSGNMVITTNDATGGTLHEYNAGTDTWTRLTSRFTSGVATLGGNVTVVRDDVHGVWCVCARDVDAGSLLMKVWTSTDRTTWTYRGSPGVPANSGINPTMAVNTTTGRIVLMARNAPSSTQDGTEIVYTSDDGGVTWTARAGFNHGKTAGSVDELAWNSTENLFMASVGATSPSDCKIYTSPDGVTWTLKATITSSCIRRIASLGNMWAGVQQTGAVIYSLDSGTTWKHADYRAGSAPLFLVASGSQLLTGATGALWPGFRAGAPGATVT